MPLHNYLLPIQLKIEIVQWYLNFSILYTAVFESLPIQKQRHN